MSFTLYRYGSIPGVGTYGFFEIDGARFETIEQPWDHNIPFHSCVPCGEYRLVPHKSNRFGINTYALVNEDLNVYYRRSDIPIDEEGRYKILIHASNVPSQLQGCIAPGTGFPVMDLRQHPPQLGVSSSSRALQALLGHIVQTGAQSLTIKQHDNDW